MSQANVELVKKLYAAFGTRDQALIFSLVSPEIEVTQSREVPWGGNYKGTEEFQQFFANLFSHIHSTLALEQFLDAGDHVVAIGRTQGKVLANDAPFDVPIAHVWRIEEGRVVAFNPYIDIPTMQASLHAGNK